MCIYIYIYIFMYICLKTLVYTCIYTYIFRDAAGSLAIRAGLISNECSMLYAEMVVTAIFIFILTIHDTIISLPFSLFKTFVVEQNHGFNKSTVGLFFRDKVKITVYFVI